MAWFKAEGLALVIVVVVLSVCIPQFISVLADTAELVVGHREAITSQLQAVD